MIFIRGMRCRDYQVSFDKSIFGRSLRGFATFFLAGGSCAAGFASLFLSAVFSDTGTGAAGSVSGVGGSGCFVTGSATTVSEAGCFLTGGAAGTDSGASMSGSGFESLEDTGTVAGFPVSTFLPSGSFDTVASMNLVGSIFCKLLSDDAGDTIFHSDCLMVSDRFGFDPGASFCR